MSDFHDLVRKADLLLDQGRLEEATQIYRALAGKSSRMPAILNRLGQIAHRQKDWKAAIEWFGRSVRAKPDQPAIHGLLGHALSKDRRNEDALRAFEQALKLGGPQQPTVLEGMGIALQNLGRHQEAMAAYDQVLAVATSAHGTWRNRGLLLAEMGRYDEAIACLDNAIVARPGFTKAHIDRAMIATCLRRYDEAMASYDSAIRSDPHAAVAHWGKAELLLLVGEHAQGWELLERRPSASSGRDFLASTPLWNGHQDVSGKTVRVMHEVGLGDFIMFARYIPALIARGARVVLDPLKPLVPLLERLQGGVEVIAKGDPLPRVDLQCRVMSLPHALRESVKDIPAPIPYLQVAADKSAQWRAHLGPRRALRVGLVWSGRADRNIDRMPIRARSMPFEKLVPLLGLPFDFHCLQKDVSDADKALAVASAARLRFHAHLLGDLHETAALATQMDVVISIDTSVAHLAGALGVPLWVMLPYASDYRWSQGKTTPWYPAARLFRQRIPGNWDDVVADVTAALAKSGSPMPPA